MEILPIEPRWKSSVKFILIWLALILTLFFTGFFRFESDLSVYGALTLTLLAIQGSVLYSTGQPLIAKSGKIHFWYGDVRGEGNSQHVTDWYTPSHILHGCIFYGVLSYVSPNLSILFRLVISTTIEGLWEIVENSPWVIQRYRDTELGAGYSGDSVLNSVCDGFSMMFGFWLTYSLPGKLIWILAITAELVCAYFIRDNLTLNVIQLIYPLEFISKWQSGGHDKPTPKSKSKK